MKKSKYRDLVLFTIAMADRPLTISDIQFRSGVSYNTIKRAVSDNPRVRKHDGYPSTFSVRKPDEFDSDVMLVHYDQPHEGWEAWLNSIRPLLVSITALSETMSAEEKQRKISMFKTLGTSFLSLAKDLEEQQ